MTNIETLRWLLLVTLLLVAGVCTGVILLFIVKSVRSLWWRWRMRHFRNLYVRDTDVSGLMNAAYMLHDAAQRVLQGEWEYESGGIMLQPLKKGFYMYSDLKLREKAHASST